MKRRGKSGKLRSRRRKSNVSRRFSPAKPTNITIVQKSAPRRSSRPKMRFYSRPRRRARGLARRSGSRRGRNMSRAAGLIAAGVAAAGLGATIGALANEAGLLNRLPSQNFMGISFTGLVGAGLIIIGLFTKSEGLKLLFYGLGGGLLIEELTRQVDMRFYDFRVAFLGAEPLDYSQGISGAQVQLAALTPQAAASPAQLPGPATSSSTSTSTPKETPGQKAIRDAAVTALNTIVLDDMAALKFFIQQAPQGDPFANSVLQVLIEKGVINDRQDLSQVPADLVALVNRLNGDEVTFRNLENQLRGGRSFVDALKRMAELGVAGQLDSLGTMRDNIRRLRPAA